MYIPPLRQGKRCIAVIQGFYEWKREGSMKQPYYIYAKQEDGIKIEDEKFCSDGWSEDEGWKGLKLLKLASIYNAFKTGTVIRKFQQTIQCLLMQYSLFEILNYREMSCTVFQC